MSSSNPFGMDGFDDGTRSTSVSVVSAPQEQSHQTNDASASSSSASSTANPFTLAAQNAAATASAAYEEFRDVGIPSAQAAVKQAAAAIHSIVYPTTEDGEPDSSRSKHGKIIVGEPELREGKLGKLTSHHVYKVSCTAGSVEHVFRRYSDFVWLRGVLVKAFPGIFIPPLPPKQIIGNKEDDFVESRRLDLQRWLARVVMRSFLSEHAAVDLFLQRATAAFEADCKEMSKQVDGQSVSVAVNLYSDLFPEILRLPTSTEATEVEIETVREFLVGCEKELGQLVSSTDKFVSVHHVGTLDLAKVASAFATLTELEKNFLEKLPTSLASQPIHPRCDINESLSAWQQSLKWSANAYDENLLAPFRFEHQDAQAMLEVFAGRKELQTRHAKSVAKSAKWNQPGNAPKKEKEELQRATDDAVAKDEGFLLDLVTRLILHAQFDQFWTFRVDQFRRRINKFARTQMEATKTLHETFAQIAAATA